MVLKALEVNQFEVVLKAQAAIHSVEMSTAHQLVQQTELQMLVTQTESTGLVLKAQELEVIELV